MPWLTDAYWLLGTVAYARNDLGGARRAWQTYLDRNPTNQTQANDVRRTMLGLRGH